MRMSFAKLLAPYAQRSNIQPVLALTKSASAGMAMSLAKRTLSYAPGSLVSRITF